MSLDRKCVHLRQYHGWNQFFFSGEQRDTPSVSSGITSHAKTYLKMRLTYLKSSGIAPYVHHPLKNSVEYVF